MSERRVGQYCSEGRVPGAQKIGKTWAIPADAEKPADPRRARQARITRNPAGEGADEQEAAAAGGEFDPANLMPLMSAAFTPGGCQEAVAAMTAGMQRGIAVAERHYFCGRAEEAAMAAGLYLESDDLAARLSAHLICAYANLPLGRIERARLCLDGARNAVALASERLPQLRAAEGFIAQTASVLLHLPIPDGTPDVREAMPLLPPGLRAFAFYVQAHALYLAGDYARSLGIAETALLMQDAIHPIPTIYLHLVAVMDLMAQREADRARAHLLAAWQLARPDGLIEGFAEHHGLLGGMLEAVIKPEWPDDFRRIIQITYRFSAGWRRVHNPATGDSVADDLTTTEFSAAMLAARGWTNAQIADHLGVSPHTVKSYISSALAKLDIQRRQDLAAYLLP